VIVEILSVGYGVGTMIGWGFGDFLAKRVVGHIGYYRLLLYTQLVGLAPVILLAALYTPLVPSSKTTISLVIGTGICTFSAMFFFYKGLQAGKASIITPVASTSAIVSIALSFAILGETLSLLQIACIGMTFTGVLVITMKSDSDGRSRAGIPYALACMLAAGLGSVLIKLVSVDIGEIATLFFNRVSVLLILLAIVPFLRKPLPAKAHTGTHRKSIIVIGLAEFAGFFSFVLGVSIGMVSITAPLSSASPAVTVVLAQTFLGERLVQIQKMAVVLVVTGIILLSIASV
jgi:transporter family protein